VKAGKTLAFCEGEIHDAGGELVARSTATFRMLAKGGK
jgi:acyl-coenzyme A thioesterase PaaI-like protein